jgi:hypothetical protein
VKPVDALLALLSLIGKAWLKTGCPHLAQGVSLVGGSPHTWGDVNCSGSIDDVDVVLLLRFSANLPLPSGVGCPAVDSPVLLD